MKGKLVVIESPYSGKTLEEVSRNIRFARACVRDSLLRGEIPFASHLIYPQPGILNDDNPEERELGIEAGLELVKDAYATMVYNNLGISKGMIYGISNATRAGRLIFYRNLKKDWEEEQKAILEEHTHNKVWNGL